MANIDFQPNWASSPGDTILDILRERNLTEEEFASRIDYKIEDVKDLIQGRIAITLGTARQLEQVLGASVEFWMTRDYQYRQDIERFNVTEEQWVNEFPIEDMIRYEWLNSFSNLREKIIAFYKFFDVSSVREWNQLYSGVVQKIAFKKSQAHESRPASVAAWLRKGEIEAKKIQCQPWDPEGFKNSLNEIRILTHHKDPNKFIPELQRICAENGVAVVIVRTPRGCPTSGATKFISKGKALLLLSFRYLTDGHFWFAFFHEAAHLLLHSESLFLETENMPSTVEEEEANEFAENILIPVAYKSEFLRLRTNTNDVIRFAVKIGVAPGIVVGQLHHKKIIPFKYLTRLQRRYKWEE